EDPNKYGLTARCVEGDAVEVIKGDIPEDDKEERQRSKESLRTCEVSLRQILRPDLLQVDGNTYEKIVSLANDTQTAITDELSCLTIKTVLIVSWKQWMFISFQRRIKDNRDLLLHL
ncbi:hypothetical protein BGZ65_011174, partial [Modicella reniformis]